MKKSDYEKLPKEEKFWDMMLKWLKKLTEEYCKQENDHLSADKPLCDEPFLASVREGCEKLEKQHPEIIKMLWYFLNFLRNSKRDIVLGKTINGFEYDFIPEII